MGLKRYTKGRSKSRSGLEDRIKADLEARNVPYEYESVKLRYTKLDCPHCQQPVKSATYTPDFVFKCRTGVYLLVEAKGYFSSSDRTKLRSVKRDNPEVNLRILFMRDDPITRGSRTRNTDWATKCGFISAVGESIPNAWLLDTSGVKL